MVVNRTGSNRYEAQSEACLFGGFDGGALHAAECRSRANTRRDGAVKGPAAWRDLPLSAYSVTDPVPFLCRSLSLGQGLGLHW